MTTKQLVLDIIAKDKTKPGFNSAAKGAGGLRKAVGGIASGIGAIGLTAFAKDSVNTFQTVTKETLALNRAVGGTTEETSRLRFAAKMSGQDLATFTKGMGLLDKNLVRAAQTGKGPVFETMTKMGVAFTDAAGKVKPLTETLPEMAEVFKNMPNGPEKTAMALQLFGRSGASLLPFLQRGKAGIEDLMSQTDEYNQVVGQEQVDAFAKNLVAQREFDAALVGIKMTLGQDLLPAITPVIKGVGDMTKAFSEVPQPIQTGLLVATAGALAWNFFGGAVGGIAKVARGAVGAMGLTTAATTADTIATNANTTAKLRNAMAAGAPLKGANKLNKGKAGAASALGSAAALALPAAGMGSFSTQATAAAGALAVLGSAFATYKITEKFGSLGGVLSTIGLGAGGPLNLIALGMGNTAREAAEAAPRLEAIRGVLAEMAKSGDSTALAGAIAQLRGELGEGFDDFINSTAPEVQSAMQSMEDAGQRLQDTLTVASRGFEWGSTKSIEYAKSVADAGRAAGKTDSEIAAMLRTAGASNKQIRIALQADPRQLDATLAESRKKLNDLKQYKKPEIAAKIGPLEGLMAKAQARVDSLKQRKKPAPRVDVERAAADVARIQHIIDNIRDGNVTIDIQRVMHAPIGGETPAKLKKGGPNGAKGGDMSGWAIVGERGPERVWLPPGSHVDTAAETRAQNYAKGKKNAKLTAKDKAFKAAQLKRLKKLRKSGGFESSNTASLREALAGARSSASGSFLSSAGLISGYDPNALADAQAEAQAAQEEINGSAVGSSARASGLARLKAARQKIADAPRSATDWVRKRVEKMRRWSAALGRLSGAWGGTPGGQQLLSEIWEKGPDGGLELAEELERAPGSIAELLNGANQAAAYAGAAAEYHPDVMNASAAYKGGQAADRQLLATVILQMDGVTLVKQLQKLKASQGGRELGLS